MNIQNVTVIVTTNYTLTASTWNYVRYACDYVYISVRNCVFYRKERKATRARRSVPFKRSGNRFLLYLV